VAIHHHLAGQFAGEVKVLRNLSKQVWDFAHSIFGFLFSNFDFFGIITNKKAAFYSSRVYAQNTTI
jgi:hypothetical protein